MNHSRSPNCEWLIPEKVLVANKEINIGDEITIDYREEVRPTREKWPEWI